MRRLTSRVLQILAPLVVLFATAAQAQTGRLLGGGLSDRMRGIAGVFARNVGLQETPLSFVVARVIFMFLAILGIIFVGLITYAGYHWLTARGNEEKVRKAQDTLRQATWGLIIVLAAYSISYFILAYLLGEFGTAPPPPLTGGAT
ncbi:MAG: Uncharacterized protein G01um101431_632 [Parcubacteria group bacterium Gr01-1014_31]|nr:MAG: Uncharacterized protein G01um101431_632 [Parcubacteria group bacterium Gr01-1014_31]